MTHDYSAYVGVGHNQPKDLPQIVKLAEAQHAAEVEVEACTEKLKAAVEKVRKISEEQLPELMESLGLSSYKTDEGISVEIKEKIRGSLSVENRPKGFDWLEKNGFGGLIETEVVVPFKRNEIEKAKTLVTELEDKELLANLERTVHHARLDGFIREQLALGKELPLDIFGVFRQRIAKVEI